MTGLVIFLSIILIFFVFVSLALIILVIGLSRQIGRAQRNAQLVESRVRHTMSAVSAVSSVLAMIAGLGAKARWLNKKIKKAGKNDRQKTS